MSNYYKNSFILGVIFAIILIPALLLFQNNDHPHKAKNFTTIYQPIKPDSFKAVTKNGTHLLYHFKGGSFFDSSGRLYDTSEFIPFDSFSYTE